MKKIIIAIAVLFVVSAAAFAADDQFWTEDPSSILKRARDYSATQSKDSGVHVLSDDVSYELRSGAVTERRYRMVYLINASSGLSSWSSISAPWDTARAERPEFKARVVSPAGIVSDLDPKTIFETPWDESSSDVYSTTKRLTAPLPNCVVGAVVQYEIVMRNSKPYFDSGETVTMRFATTYPTMRKRLSVRYDRKTLYRVKLTRPEGLSAASENSGDFTSAAYEASTPPLWSSFEPMMPDADLPASSVAVSTGSTWKAVADRYRQLSEPSIKPAALASLALKRNNGESALGFAERCRLAIIAKGIRYTALHYGEYGLVPASTKDVLDRGYGDCKDQAALLAAMLRNAGVDASLALIATGPGRDADPELPGMGLFDHAIVYVPGAEPFWVDPSARYYPAGRLHPSSQGRLSLVVSRGELVRTPESSSSDNRIEETREMSLAEEDGAEVSETTFAYGVFDATYRSSYARSDRERSLKRLGSYVENVFGKHADMKADIWDSDDFSKPFKLRLSASDARSGGAFNRSLYAVLDGKHVFSSEMPDFCYVSLKDGGKEKREKDLVLDAPFRFSIEYLVRPPEGYAVDELPENRELRAGPAVYEERFESLPDGSVKARFAFDSGGAVVKAADYPALYKVLSGLYSEKRKELSFLSKGEIALEENRVAEALAEFRALAALHPGHGLHSRQLARVQAILGLRESARALAAAAAKNDPDNFIAAIDEAIVLRHGSSGTWYGVGWDREAALRALNAADKLDPGNGNTIRNLAIVTALGADAEWMGPGSDAEAALALLSRAEESGIDCDDLFRIFYEESGRWNDVLDLLKPKAKESSVRDRYLYAYYRVNGAEALMKEARRLVRDMKARNEAIGSVVQRAFQECEFKDSVILVKAFYADLSLPFPPELKAADDLLSSPPSASPSSSLADPASAARTFFRASSTGRMEDAHRAISSGAADYIDRNDLDILAAVERGAASTGLNPKKSMPLIDALWDRGCEYATREISPGLNEVVVTVKPEYSPAMGSVWKGKDFAVWTIAEGGEHRIVGVQGGATASLICADAWLSEGKTDLASAILKAVHDREEAGALKEVLSGSWDAPRETMRRKIGVALANEAGGPACDKRARSILYALPASSIPSGPEGNDVRKALAFLELRLGNREESRNAARRIRLSDIKTDLEVVSALTLRGEFADALKRTREIKQPEEAVTAALVLSDGQYRTGDPAASFRTLDELVKRDFGSPSSNDLAARTMLQRNVANQRCWFALMAGLLKGEDLRELEGLVKNSPNADFAVHTLVCGYAAIGRLDEAVMLLHAYGANIKEPEKDLAFRFARALVVEAAGFAPEARSLYLAITEDWKGEIDDDVEMVNYARRKAAALK